MVGGNGEAWWWWWEAKAPPNQVYRDISFLSIWDFVDRNGYFLPLLLIRGFLPSPNSALERLVVVVRMGYTRFLLGSWVLGSWFLAPLEWRGWDGHVLGFAEPLICSLSIASSDV
jgi:hypothetical protein